MDDISTNVNKTKGNLSSDDQHFHKYQPNRDM